MASTSSDLLYGCKHFHASCVAPLKTSARLGTKGAGLLDHLILAHQPRLSYGQNRGVGPNAELAVCSISIATSGAWPPEARKGAERKNCGGGAPHVAGGALYVVMAEE